MCALADPECLSIMRSDPILYWFFGKAPEVAWTIWKLAAELEEAIDRPLDVVPLEPSTPFTRRIEERGEVLFERE